MSPSTTPRPVAGTRIRTAAGPSRTTVLRNFSRALVTLTVPAAVLFGASPAFAVDHYVSNHGSRSCNHHEWRSHCGDDSDWNSDEDDDDSNDYSDADQQRNGSTNDFRGNARGVAFAGGMKLVRPVTGRITSPFGPRWGGFHYGVDIGAPIGTPIYAVADGVVEESGPATGFGLWVVLRHPDGSKSVYGHVNRSFVGVGERVSVGERIAEVGNRGNSTGPHLHLEIWAPNGKRVDPLPVLRSHNVVI